jgi:hypothetical protein
MKAITAATRFSPHSIGNGHVTRLCDLWVSTFDQFIGLTPGPYRRPSFAQLQRYAIALENPPLLIVSDMERFLIHTNWTNTVQKVYDLTLDDLEDENKRRHLKWAFSETDVERLRPDKTRAELTEEVAARFAQLALRLRDQGHDPQAVAHFVNRLVFCMFAEDVGLLPNNMFTRMLQVSARQAHEFETHARQLFAAMKSGGSVGFERVEYFNGGLFEDDSTLPLAEEDIKQTLEVALLDGRTSIRQLWARCSSAASIQTSGRS